MADEFDTTIFLPKVGKNYISPSIITIPTGTVYQLKRFSRPVILQALTPASVGTIYAYPGSSPGSDELAIPSAVGVIFLDGLGDWYIRHTGVGEERFRVIDAGGAGNAAASASTIITGPTNLTQIGGTAQTALDLTAKYVAPTTFVSATPFATTAGDSAMLAAAAGRKLLTVVNNGTAWCAVGAKASALTGLSDNAVFFIVPPNSSYTWQAPGQPPPVAAIRVYTSSNGSTIYAQEGS